MNEHHPLSKHVANSMAIGTLDKDVKKVIEPNNPLFIQIWEMDH